MARPLQNTILALSLAVCLTMQVDAAKPAASLLPSTTKAYVSVPDIDLLREHWSETQLGKLVADPVMKPFVEDLKRQLREKMSQTTVRLGIGWEDLDGVYGGEACVALVQPWDVVAAQALIDEAVQQAREKARAAGGDAKAVEAAGVEAAKKTTEIVEKQRRLQAAVVVLVDVTGHIEEAKDLLEKIAKNQVEKGAKQGVLKVADVDVVSFTMPPKEGHKVVRQAFYCIHEDQLISTDRQDVLAEILSRFAEADAGTLEGLEAFAATQASAAASFEKTTAHIHWFLEPFGYAEVARAYAGGRKRRGADMLRVLQNQGFKAIRGLGGRIAFKTEEHDVCHHTLIYAPAVKRGAGDLARSKYDLAARMLDFPNTNNLLPKAWIPRGLATHLTFNWKMQDAFWHAETLVNEIAGDDVFDDVIANIEHDPHGPRIKVKEEFTDHLGERATLISDYQLPITPKSERLLLAIEVANPKLVMKTVNKAMENDPAAKKRVIAGQIIWELKNEAAEAEELQIEGFDGGFGFDDPMAVSPEDEEKPFIPNSAVTVAHGHLLIATHVDYIVQLLKTPPAAETLAQAADYVAMTEALTDLGAGTDSFRAFTRTDEAYRVTYQLMKEGRMPESESMLGKLLNRMMASDEDDEEELREQEIDGSKMPDFQVVRRYLGPNGFYVRTVDDGWVISGCMLTKEMKPTAE